MPDLAKLSAAKLRAEIDKRESTHSALLDETIAAGYGAYTGRQIRDIIRANPWPLLVEHIAACDARDAANAELDARRRYHGSDKPIRRPAYA